MASKTSSNFRQHPPSLRTSIPNGNSQEDSGIASDASNIPKPSPKTARPAPTARPRRAIGNTKTLKAAWDHSASARPRNGDASSAYHIDKTALPAQPRRESPAPLQQKHRGSTPSPPRPATGDSLASPEYSSPPKGLEDTYQRIADEELLAAQEGAISDEEASDGASRYSRDHARVDRLRRSSPGPLRNSRRNSPRPRSVIDLIQEAESKENLLEGDTDATQASGMSFLENMTDQALAAKLTPHAIDRAKDRVRLERALQKDSPMFSKIRSREPLTEENLQRGSGNEGGATNGSSADSISSSRRDAPLNVPRTWGSRAKPQNDWLKRIYSPSGSPNHDTSHVDRPATADDVPFAQAPSSNHSTPTSARSQTSLDQTGNSIAQTPAAPGAWTDTILPDTIKTLKQGTLPKYLQTPHVTGGWIDTPLLAAKRPSSVPLQRPIAEEDEGAGTDAAGEAEARSHSDSEAVNPLSNQQKALDIPRSALDGLLEKAKRTRAQSPERMDTFNMGDATLDSLEDLLTLDATEMTTLIRMSAQLDAKPPENAISIGTEGELLERLGTKLDRLRTNIHDARKGISKLEHQVSHSDGSINGDERPLRKGPCRTCGCPGGSTSTSGWVPTNTASRVYLAVPLPRIFHDRQPSQWILRPTPLGYILLACGGWYCAEQLMCAYYCKPLYASFYHRPPEPEPFPGRALPTMLWRWFIRPWFWPLWTILWPFIKAFGMMLGVWDGFVDVPLGAGVESALGYSWERSREAKTGSGLDVSMMNDEFL